MIERHGVSAAEKYAELEAAGLERPRCKCHEETMRWNKKKNYAEGGFWACLMKQREYDLQRYPTIRERKQIRDRARKSSPEGREKERLQRQRRYERYRSAGLCAACGKRPLASEWSCNECLDNKITPLNLLKARRREAVKRMTARKERER